MLATVGAIEGLAEAFLDQEELDSGIVVRRGNTVQFWHLTFQEYLAARALASCSEDAQRKRLLAKPDKLYQPEWREVVLLAAGVLHYQGVRRVDAIFSAILDQLGKKPSLADQARCYGLLGAAVRDLAPVDYQPADPRYGKVAKEAMAIFNAERSKSVAIEVAIEAAEALGQAGDPRFAPRNLENNWVTIPAGEFLMGAQREERSSANCDPEGWDAESPVHKVRSEEYRIRKHPVTVGEYQRFVYDGGYVKEMYWQAGGFGKSQQPDKWDEQLAHANRPVVGVSWYDAAAYAAWAGCRLPTEAEWERAARGTEGRRYPWGDGNPSPNLANYYKGKVGHATPVGVYPRGATPDGLLDMAGNVWEWCQDVWHDSYNGAPTDGSTWITGGTESGHVVRGGAWYTDEIGLRSAFRHWDRPGRRSDGIGFRVSAEA